MSCLDRFSVPASSTEYVRAQITHWAGTATDPTAFPVEFAFTRARDVNPTMWYTGDWQVLLRKAYARILIGPGTDVVLTPGFYSVWIRINSFPEKPVRQVGAIEIT